jgi:hypothetical protein
MLLLKISFQQTALAQPPAGPKEAGPLTFDRDGTWHYKKRYLPTGVRPGTCDEWATQSPPIAPAGTLCKRLGGNKDICNYRFPPDAHGTYNIGADSLTGVVNQDIPVDFEVDHFGLGDAIIYMFGKVDWGDLSQTSATPFGRKITLSHSYQAAGTYTLHAMFAAQFKYDNSVWSGSYEACVDSKDVSVTIN